MAAPKTFIISVRVNIACDGSKAGSVMFTFFAEFEQEKLIFDGLSSDTCIVFHLKRFQ